MATFLLEIGTEELPADFARLAQGQLKDAVEHGLAAASILPGSISVLGTPRRLAIRVEALPSNQPDIREERKGPPASQAFAGDQPGPAAVGFARRCGIDPSALEVRNTVKGPFVFATVVTRGRPTQELLSELIPGWIAALQGRRFMRWGEGSHRFSRPVRWLVALLDSEVIPVTLEGCDPPVRSGRRSRGHRLVQDDVEIRTAQDYQQSLAVAGVQVGRETRRATILDAVAEASASLNARADLPTDLLEELTDLVEAPELLTGVVPERFLSLPAEVLSTVMRVHQRYVSLYRVDAAPDPLALDARQTLLPSFLFVGNGLSKAAPWVCRGNERVLCARLADAEFFIQADRSVASIDRRDQLARVMFAEKLGSLLERVERLEWWTDVLLEQLQLPAAVGEAARRAAHLCKHDLVSQMVGEFPELQGVMGAKYLLAEGEPREVALAVLEHYLPRGAGDLLPQSEPGAVVALAERLELLHSIFAMGERPSGSSDPYALRRAGNGLLQILWARGWTLDLICVLDRGASHWAELMPQFPIKVEALAAELGEFLRQRLLTLLEESGVDSDLSAAVAGSGVPLERVVGDPFDARERAGLLMGLRASGELATLQAVVTRATRLADKGHLDADVLSAQGVVNPELFERSSEYEMLAVLDRLEPLATGAGADRYRLLAHGLGSSTATLAGYFDGPESVMVMVDDEDLRNNRLNLLAVLRNQASVLADFRRITAQ
ncbi:MAG: glycine--tRNA ligase subunit beta [Cyanobacteriota bacterium]|nr:glycine--tRNA ligase subunit beta [Cyanobacteriota bacterium]